MLANARCDALGRVVQGSDVVRGQRVPEHAGTRNRDHSVPHGSREVVSGLPEPHVTRVSRYECFQGAYTSVM